MTILKIVSSLSMLVALAIPAAAQEPRPSSRAQSPRDMVLDALARQSGAQDSQCSTPQSPRRIDRNAPHMGSTRTSIVEQTDLGTLVYRGGQTLYLCERHYHFPIENPQGCAGENQTTSEVEPGQWVEVHTVYAASVGPVGCTHHDLDCCEAGPFVVRAFAAKVTAEGLKTVIPEPTGRPLAEWSGSTTGPDKVPNECKKPAEWSFRLSCDFTVSEAQLIRLGHPHPARRPQPVSRLSRDLRLVQ